MVRSGVPVAAWVDGTHGRGFGAAGGRRSDCVRRADDEVDQQAL